MAQFNSMYPTLYVQDTHRPFKHSACVYEKGRPALRQTVLNKLVFSSGAYICSVGSRIAGTLILRIEGHNCVV